MTNDETRNWELMPNFTRQFSTTMEAENQTPWRGHFVIRHSSFVIFLP